MQRSSSDRESEDENDKGYATSTKNLQARDEAIDTHSESLSETENVSKKTGVFHASGYCSVHEGRDGL